jgi:crossover junction endodeoxyribonuclease RuvC
MRVIAFDTSLNLPGVAVVEVKRKKPRIVALGHVRTNGKDNYAARTKHIEAYMHLFIRQHMPYDAIVRESFAGKMPNINYAIFSAWNACDRALADFQLTVTEKAIGQSSVKKSVVGRGKAEKHEVEEAVRKWTGYKGEFATSDESDAAAIGLAYLIENNLIEGEPK